MKNILKAEAKKQERLQDRSASAIDMVTRIINELDEINSAIDQERSRIQGLVAGLNERDAALLQLSSRNAGIIKNFTRLIEGGTEI